MVLQRVSEASVTVDGDVIGEIQQGYLILLGVEERDSSSDLEWLVKKISQLRIFGDEEGKMNRSLLEIEGSALVVSQFTLHANTKKGNRPSFIRAARPEIAQTLYQEFCQRLGVLLNGRIATGRFGADMKVTLVNDGPVTITMDSQNRE